MLLLTCSPEFSDNLSEFRQDKVHEQLTGKGSQRQPMDEPTARLAERRELAKAGRLPTAR